MGNIDVGLKFNHWFLGGFIVIVAQGAMQILLGLSMLCCKLKSWIRTCYSVIDLAILLSTFAWLSFGAYWRYSEFGIMCSQSYLKS